MFHKITSLSTIFGAAALLFGSQAVTQALTPAPTSAILNVNGAINVNAKPIGAVFIAANYLNNKIGGYGYINTATWKFMGNATDAQFAANADGTISSHFVFFGLYTVNNKRSIAQMDVTTTSTTKGVGKVGYSITGLFDSNNRPLSPSPILSASGPANALLTQLPVSPGYVSLQPK